LPFVKQIDILVGFYRKPCFSASKNMNYGWKPGGVTFFSTFARTAFEGEIVFKQLSMVGFREWLPGGCHYEV
jgi:hypothetical protein